MAARHMNFCSLHLFAKCLLEALIGELGACAALPLYHDTLRADNLVKIAVYEYDAAGKPGGRNFRSGDTILMLAPFASPSQALSRARAFTFSCS